MHGWELYGMWMRVGWHERGWDGMNEGGMA